MASHWHLFDPREKELLPVPAVYVLYDKDGFLIYVGKTVNLRQRMAAHRSKRLSLAKARVVTSTKERSSIERRLIARLKPCRNVVDTGIYRPRSERPLVRMPWR
jgi:excinuclease UvrABC nuclease subunit